ncbi:hypothetical protein [Desulfosporosinus acidiphilus]|uniref:hypothetical protein n=1 Tax=Desulfosporosinus acidiphilus TaxID=885581 RepID=UPI0011D22004|nr:hypothetical protein [Desulfosporosinus acidiphilus]
MQQANAQVSSTSNAIHLQAKIYVYNKSGRKSGEAINPLPVIGFAKKLKTSNEKSPPLSGLFIESAFAFSLLNGGFCLVGNILGTSFGHVEYNVSTFSISSYAI